MAAVPPLPKSFEDAALHHAAVAEELERVCGSSHFRSSRRSCEFLRYIVRVTLDGRTDSLKERSIGIDLFGRDTSYEPSSDATVRVRANEVRKRLSSYYASAASSGLYSIRIDLPTGSYVPHFLPVAPGAGLLVLPAQSSSMGQPISVPAPWPAYTGAVVQDPAPHDEPKIPSGLFPLPFAEVAISAVPPIRSLTLMRPALLALLVCALLLRHQLENREEYLRFWDRLLSGRSAMVLSVSPQDRVNLAPSLYPLVWVAGRYGVDAVLHGDSLTGVQPEDASSVQVSYTSPPETATDSRLRWAFDPPPSFASKPAESGRLPVLVDRKAVAKSTTGPPVSAALLTVLPESSSTLFVQGSDADAIRRLLEELTTQRNFPLGLVEGIERLDSRHALQVLIFRNSNGDWIRQIYWGEA